MKLGIKKYMSIVVCAAFLLSMVNIDIDTVKAQPAALVGAITINGFIFEDIGTDTYKNGLLWDKLVNPNDDWDLMTGAGDEDNGAFEAPAEALVGVSVYFDDNPIPIATTGAGGVWGAGITTFLGKHYLTFRMDGYVTKTRNIDVYVAGIDCDPIFLERADAVIGRVTDTSGAPITGARVIAYPRNPPSWALTDAVHDAFLPPGPNDGRHIIEGFTDKFGNYVLKGLQKGNYEIRVTREEYSPQFKTIYGINTDLGPKTLDFTLTLNPGVLEGYVHDLAVPANPIANATVSIPGLSLSATTDASGYYKIEQIPAGMYTVVTKAQGYSTEVYYYNDAPHPDQLGNANPFPNPDNSGNYNTANPYTHPGWGGYAPYISAGQTISNFDFQMDVATQECENDISGIVSNGAPIEYAEVEIPGLHDPDEPVPPPHVPWEITTDKSGYYIFTEVPCGTYWVVASDPEPDPTGLLDHKSKKALVVCTIGQDIVQDFVLDENPCTIFGRVLQYDSDWIPVANATVEIPNAGISTTTDSFGYYVIENLPVKRWSWWSDTEGFAYKTTEYLLKVSKSGYFSTTEYVKPVPQSTVWQEFHIKKHTAILKGKVTEWDTNQGIKDIKVTCAGREDYTDSNGFYEFVEIPIGSYTVHAEDYTWDFLPPNTYPNYDNKAKINQQVTYGNVTIVDFRLPDHAAGKITGSVSGYIWYDWNASGGFSNEGEGVKDADVTISGKNSVYTDSYGYYVSIADTQDIYGQYDTLVIKQGAPGHVVTVDAPGYFIAHSNVQTIVDIDITDASLSPPWPPLIVQPLNIQINKLIGDLKGTVYDKDKLKPLEFHIVTVPLAGAPSGYVPFYDGVPTAYTTAWPSTLTDTLGTYLITGIPKGDHLIWEYASPLIPNYHDMFERVNIQSLINKNFGATRKIGRIEGYVWDDADNNRTFDPNETSLFNAVVKLSGKSTDPLSNDDNYSSIADSTGYYTILNVRITRDWLDDYWNRYTGTAEYSGFYKEKWEYPIPPGPWTPRYLFDNNIEVRWADRRVFETTVPFSGWSFNYPLNKKDGGPLSGGPDGLISGYVDLYLALYSSNAEIWVQNTSYNVVSDIEGYYLVWNFGVASPPPQGTIIVNNAPWGIPAGNYALRARALWYESDVLGAIETYDPEIYPNTVTVHSETSGISFDLSRKARGISGTVLEDTQDAEGNEIVEDQYGNPIDNGTTLPPDDKYLFIKNATVTIGNPDNGIGLPWWQKNTVDGGEYEFNDQQNGILPINEALGIWRYMIWYQKDSCWIEQQWYFINPNFTPSVLPLPTIIMQRWFGFIDGFVLDCNTYKPIVNADVNATKQRTNPNPSATNEVATYNYDAAENPPINNTDIEGYYLVDCSVSTPKVHPDETEYTVNAAKTNYPAKCLNNITVEFNEINEDNDFLLCKELGNMGVVLGIVYVDADTDGVYDAGEEIGGVTVDIPGLDMTTISTTDVYQYDIGGTDYDYNFIFVDVPLLTYDPPVNNNMARYWLKFTHPDHEMGYAIFETVTPTVYNPAYIASYYSNYTTSGVWPDIGTEDTIMDDLGNCIPLCGLQTVPDAWIEGLVYAPGSPDERLTDRDDDAKVWIPGAYRQCPTDDVGYYIIGELAPYMPVGSTYPTVHTLVATATGYKPKSQRNVGLNSDTPWNHTWQDFSMELLTSMDYGILQGVVYFDGGIAPGDVGDPPGAPYDLGICSTGGGPPGNYDGPDPANPFEGGGAYDVIGTGEDTNTEGIRNAVVTLNPTTTTDSYGYYILTDITSEMSHLVDVTVDLFQDAHHNVFVDSGWNTENFAMDAETGSISGRVYEDFDQDDMYDDPLEAIENATVRAWISATPSFSVSVYTEADGMYLMPLVPVPIATGSYTVHAEQVSGTPRYEPNEVDDVHVDPGVTTTGVDITLMREHGDVSGTVTYGGGTPLYGATVKFFFHWYSTYVEIFDTTTDASGFYMFDTEDDNGNNILDPGEDVDMDCMLDELWEGQWTIQVSHPAFTTKTKDIIVASHYTVDFDFAVPGDLLPQTAKIEGLVSASGPVPGAIITADRGDIQVQAVSGLSGAYEIWVPWGFYGTISCYDTSRGTLTAGPYNIMDYGAPTPPQPTPPPFFDDLPPTDGEFDDLTLNFDYSGVVSLSTPLNGATLTSLNVTFNWNTFSGASTYTIHVDDTPDCSSPIYTNTVSGTTDSYTFSSYGTYYWRVNADGNPSTWSMIWSFTLSSTAGGPTLLTPPNGTTITDQTPYFSWMPVGGSPGSYTIQVDDTPDFSSSLEINHTVSHPTTDYTPGSNLTDKTGYWWRVKANITGWSDTWYFYIDTTAGRVSGTVTHSGGTPLGDVKVLAYIIEVWGKWELVGSDISDASGNYDLNPLPSGVQIHIAFYKLSYKAETLLVTLAPLEHKTTGTSIDLDAGTTYTIQLKTGWNLISFPLIIDEITPIPAIFYPIEGKYTRIHLWDASSGYYVNYRVTPDLTYQNEFWELKMDVGYWVHATEDTNFVLSGVTNINPRDIHLYHGWNMMGYPFSTAKTISTAVTANYNKINLMWRWNAVTDTYELFDPWGRFTNQFTTFTPGYGYWVYADEDTTITIQ